MGLGVLEDTKLAHVPGKIPCLYPPRRKRIRVAHHNFKTSGTSDIYEQNGDASDQTPGASGLKCDWSGNQPIILVPQPSDDPNDPLVCPREHRTLEFVSTTKVLTRMVLLELAIMATRYDSCHPLLRNDPLHNPKLYPSRKYSHHRRLRGNHVYSSRPVDWISPMRCRRGGNSHCANGSGLG